MSRVRQQRQRTCPQSSNNLRDEVDPDQRESNAELACGSITLVQMVMFVRTLRRHIVQSIPAVTRCESRRVRHRFANTECRRQQWETL